MTGSNHVQVNLRTTTDLCFKCVLVDFKPERKNHSLAVRQMVKALSIATRTQGFGQEIVQFYLHQSVYADGIWH